MKNVIADRVVFYSVDEPLILHHLKRCEVVIFGEIESFTDPNDILELYNIKKFIDNNIFLPEWTEQDIIIVKQKVKGFEKEIGKFINKVKNENFLEVFLKVDWDYKESFWSLFNNRKTAKNISKDSFSSLLTQNPIHIHKILLFKYIVERFDNEIKYALLSYPEFGKNLIDHFVLKDNQINQHINYPSSLTIKDKEEIISNFLDLENPNLNYVNQIPKIQNSSEFAISDKIKLKAKRKAKELNEMFFNDKATLITSTKISVSFIDEIEVPIKFNRVNDVDSYSYSNIFIERFNTDFDLFLNLKDLFGFFDNQNRITLFSKKSQINSLERVIGFHPESDYFESNRFEYDQFLSLMQTHGYFEALSKMGHSLEKIFKNIFTTSFQERFHFDKNAVFHVPKKDISYFEKLRIIAPELESILKQFKLFVENKEIDFDLLELSSKPITFSEIPSLVNNKYLYLNEENMEVNKCMRLLFSSYSELNYINYSPEKSHSNFIELLSKEIISYSELNDYQKELIDFLINLEFLKINNIGNLELNNFNRILILNDIRQNEVASFYHYSKKLKIEALKMSECNLVRFESSLFSMPEQSYFNYYLNRKEFANGLDLRNRYLHGTQPAIGNTSVHEGNYFRYLNLIGLVLFKIMDDLEIWNNYIVES